MGRGVTGSSRAPATLLLAHGSGGRLTQELVRDAFLPVLGNPWLATLTDAAVLPELPPGRPALTTDAFVVDPALFPGGDLGYLSVVGTVNDLAMVGARPLWLTWALVLEEGASGELISTCAAGAARAAAEAGIAIVAGDTKVVPRGKGDGIYAVTAGLGVVPPGRDVGDHRIVARRRGARVGADRRPRRDHHGLPPRSRQRRACARTARPRPRWSRRCSPRARRSTRSTTRPGAACSRSATRPPSGAACASTSTSSRSRSDPRSERCARCSGSRC